MQLHSLLETKRMLCVRSSRYASVIPSILGSRRSEGRTFTLHFGVMSTVLSRWSSRSNFSAVPYNINDKDRAVPAIFNLKNPDHQFSVLRIRAMFNLKPRRFN